MNHCRNVIAFFLILILTCAGGLHAAESTREGGLSNTIVIFRDGVPWEEVDSYALEWESRGTTRIMDLPMINGIVLDVPWEVTPAAVLLPPKASFKMPSLPRPFCRVSTIVFAPTRGAMASAAARVS